MTKVTSKGYPVRYRVADGTYKEYYGLTPEQKFAARGVGVDRARAAAKARWRPPWRQRHEEWAKKAKRQAISRSFWIKQRQGSSEGVVKGAEQCPPP